MRQWFGVSPNAALNRRCTQFISYADYKIINSNVRDWANVTKIHASSSAKPSTFLLDEHALYNFATGNGELHSCPNSLSVMWSAKRTFFFNGILIRVALGTRMGELSKADIKTAGPLLFASKSTVKHVIWSNGCRV